MRRWEVAREDAHQRAVLYPGLTQLEPHQAYAQAQRGGVAHQANVVEAGTVHGLRPVQLVCGKPGAPRFQRAAQQLGTLQLGHAVEGSVLQQVVRRGQRRDLVLQQADVFDVGIAAGAKAYREVGVFGDHVQQRDRHLQRQVDLGVVVHEMAQPRHQDGACKGGRHRHLELAFARHRRATGKARQHAQAFAHMGQVFAAFGGQREVGPAKQPRAQQLFQLLDAVADGTGRDAQLLRRLGARAQPRQCLKGQQTLDRRDANAHLKITVLWPFSSTRCSLCHLTARASTWLSVSRPIAVRSSTVLLWSARATSCSMIGPSSRSAVT